jgi:2-keto-myo-inositol isomerase
LAPPGDMVRNMLTRRAALLAPAAAAMAAPPSTMQLCLHQTTSAAAGYRRSLEGYAKAGIKYVELIPPHFEEFVKTDGMPAAKRLLSDLGLKAVSSSGVRGLAEPSPNRAKVLEELKPRVAMIAELGIDRMVCPCAAAEKYVLDDYKRAQDNLREAGEIVKPYGVVAMLEFMRASTFVGTLPTSLNLTRDTAHPYIKSMLDCYHFWAGLSKFEDLDLIRPREIPHVHFQDVPGIPRELLDNGTRDIPGDGVSPLVAILKALKNKGYSGPVSVELFYPQLQKGDPYEVASAIRRKAEPIMRRAGVM